MGTCHGFQYSLKPKTTALPYVEPIIHHCPIYTPPANVCFRYRNETLTRNGLKNIRFKITLKATDTAFITESLSNYISYTFITVVLKTLTSSALFSSSNCFNCNSISKISLSDSQSSMVKGFKRAINQNQKNEKTSSNEN